MNYFDHFPIKNRSIAIFTELCSVNRYILAWETTDHYISLVGKRVHCLHNITDMNFVIEIQIISGTCRFTNIVRPNDLKWQPAEVLPHKFKIAEEA